MLHHNYLKLNYSRACCINNYSFKKYTVKAIVFASLQKHIDRLLPAKSATLAKRLPKHSDAIFRFLLDYGLFAPPVIAEYTTA